MNALAVPFTIDVVDDDPDVLGSLRFLLETEGFDVRTFSSGAAFLAASPRPRPDCLVIDYKMEDMNGIDLIRCLRGRLAAASIVLITGHPDETIPQKAAAMGVRHVVLKPHVEESLIMHVRAALDESSADRARIDIGETPYRGST